MLLLFYLITSVASYSSIPPVNKGDTSIPLYDVVFSKDENVTDFVHKHELFFRNICLKEMALQDKIEARLNRQFFGRDFDSFENSFENFEDGNKIDWQDDDEQQAQHDHHREKRGLGSLFQAMPSFSTSAARMSGVMHAGGRMFDRFRTAQHLRRGAVPAYAMPNGIRTVAKFNGAQATSNMYMRLMLTQLPKYARSSLAKLKQKHPKTYKWIKRASWLGGAAATAAGAGAGITQLVNHHQEVVSK